MFHKTEESIIQHWKFDPTKPVVSVCCITYNQKDYIEQAIDSFLMQETDFPFEILIHDDASTDGTAGIVKAYAAKYPNLIRIVLQLENQYSQNTIITPRFLWPIAKGEYIAMCEGDDYWTSPIKLNTQVNIMNQFPDVSMSFHAALVLNENDKDIASEIGQFGDKLKVLSQKYVIKKGGG